jgi:hypothetical protein
MPKTDHGDGLFRLVYASRAVLPQLPRFEGLVEDVLKVSVPNNTRTGLTGLLLAHQGWFVQALEGPRRNVSATFGVIGRDLRHVRLEMLSAGEVGERLFGQWSMCARAITPAARPALRALEIDGEFDPMRLSADKALKLLLTLGMIEPTGAKNENARTPSSKASGRSVVRI